MFINQITFRDKPTQHFKTPIANEGSYILYYAYIKPNFKKRFGSMNTKMNMDFIERKSLDSFQN
jgi:hypothetical protein